MPDLHLSTNVKLHYLDPNPGEKPVVLLLHGLGVTGESWSLQFPALIEAGLRPLAPDLRGFGHSSYPGGGGRIATFAGDMAALLEQLDVAPAHVVGISLGGTVALQLALDHPELVRKLVLVNTFARLRPKGVRGYLYFALRMLMVHTLGIPAQARAVAKHMFPKPEQESSRADLIRQVSQANPKAYRATMRALARFDVLDRLGALVLPTLIITGSEDSTVDPENQKMLVERIPNARQEIIPGAGHAVSVDAPETFNRILPDFIIQS